LNQNRIFIFLFGGVFFTRTAIHPATKSGASSRENASRRQRG
jgi:hypothetical protein